MANLVIPYDKYFDTKNVISVRAASDALDDGYLIQASSLVTGERDVYTATQINAITLNYLAMVVGYNFYEDSLGNRPNVSDPTQITYPAGSDVTAYRLIKNSRFFMSSGTYTGTPAVGQFLIPTADAYTWAAAASLGGTELYAFIVEAISVTGSYRGLNGITGVIARVAVGD